MQQRERDISPRQEPVGSSEGKSLRSLRQDFDDEIRYALMEMQVIQWDDIISGKTDLDVAAITVVPPVDIEWQTQNSFIGRGELISPGIVVVSTDANSIQSGNVTIAPDKHRGYLVDASSVVPNLQIGITRIRADFSGPAKISLDTEGFSNSEMAIGPVGDGELESLLVIVHNPNADHGDEKVQTTAILMNRGWRAIIGKDGRLKSEEELLGQGKKPEPAVITQPIESTYEAIPTPDEKRFTLFLKKVQGLPKYDGRASRVDPDTRSALWNNADDVQVTPSETGIAIAFHANADNITRFLASCDQPMWRDAIANGLREGTAWNGTNVNNKKVRIEARLVDGKLEYSAVRLRLDTGSFRFVANGPVSTVHPEVFFTIFDQIKAPAKPEEITPTDERSYHSGSGWNYGVYEDRSYERSGWHYDSESQRYVEKSDYGSSHHRQDNRRYYPRESQQRPQEGGEQTVYTWRAPEPKKTKYIIEKPKVPPGGSLGSADRRAQRAKKKKK